MKKIISVTYQFGETVVLKSDPDVRRVVSGYLVRPKQVLYLLSQGDNETGHQDIEIMPVFKPFKIKGYVGK